MYKLRYAKKFEKSVRKLPDEMKKVLAKQLVLLEQDPYHNSLYTKKNHFASNSLKETIFESRINQNYRILWKHEDGKVILLLVAGNHKLVEGKK
ncbi:hypothetical protein JYU11_02180 [bacterium AH-315-G05]|nr:hypothetical protein [bacterium AH-315-L21]MBN4062867.1 hypothetical protein [Alkaliphilus sp. AH-315-G20]MBN4067885.1 hypothetical protein [Alkaliphilus transvaalensis]MBN4069693.1 hypothetical protein [bacterium AH-315-G05]